MTTRAARTARRTRGGTATGPGARLTSRANVSGSTTSGTVVRTVNHVVCHIAGPEVAVAQQFAVVAETAPRPAATREAVGEQALPRRPDHRPQQEQEVQEEERGGEQQPRAPVLGALRRHAPRTACEGVGERFVPDGHDQTGSASRGTGSSRTRNWSRPTFGFEPPVTTPRNAPYASFSRSEPEPENHTAGRRSCSAPPRRSATAGRASGTSRCRAPASRPGRGRPATTCRTG